MPRSPQSPQPSLDDIRHLLEASRSAHLATASADADPHLMPVVYALHDDAIWIAIDEKPKTTLRLRRLRNIEENARAALLLDHYDDDWSQLWWLLIRGPAEVWWPQTWHARQAAAAIAALRARYPQYKTMTLEERPLLRITPDRITHWSPHPTSPPIVGGD